MGFTGLVVLTVLAFAVIMIRLIINNVKNRDWKKAILFTAAFIVGLVIVYTGMITFITSM